MSESTNEVRILCVDDEPRVLDGMRRTLGMSFEVSTAESGAQALALLEKKERFAVTISDMRMPGMDGAAYLERAAALDPDMVRMLLTGQADMQAAIRAVNQGRIFRFLTKPCDADALERAVKDALEQHRLITAEKELLEKTLYGCIKVLTDLLSLINPIAFNRACRVNRLVQHTAKMLSLDEPWQLELAVMLSHLGFVGVAPEVLEKAFAGKPLGAADKTQIAGAPRMAHGLMAGVPRIEVVLSIIDKLADAPPKLEKIIAKTKEGKVPWATHVILACERADQLSHSHPGGRAIADAMKPEGWNSIVLEAVARAPFETAEKRKVVRLSARELEPGMFLVEDARSSAGVLMAKGGQEVTATVVTLLRRMAERQNLKEPLIVSVTT